tara:strand:- start:909 stop:1184 length:276 start_codon:yes stop_codon:yes gene_type:complete
MTKQKVVPIGRKVLIKNKKAAQFYSGTQIIRTEAVEDFVADIVAVGDLVDNLSIGDTVKYSEHSMGIEMMHEGEKVLLVNCDMIFAKIFDV